MLLAILLVNFQVSEFLGVGCIKIDIAIHSFFIHLAADGISILHFIFKMDLIISNDS